MRIFRYWAVLAVMSVPALTGGCARNPVTGKLEFSAISVEQEVAMGDEAAPEFEKEFDGKVADETLQAYVRGVGARLAAVSDRKVVTYEYALLASDVPNAFALPGGKIYVTAGLMVRMKNERELAAVLGHETGHVAYKHNVKALEKQIGVILLAKLAGWAVGGEAGKAAEAGAEIAGAMVTLRYSRKHELQADSVGIRYMTKAGYNPYGMVELLSTLKGLEEREPGAFETMFSTHPGTSERIELAREIIENEYPVHSPAVADPKAGQFVEMRELLKRKLAGGGD